MNDKDQIEKDRIGLDADPFFRIVKGLDWIADPFLTKGLGSSDCRSRKKYRIIHFSDFIIGMHLCIFLHVKILQMT